MFNIGYALKITDLTTFFTVTATLCLIVTLFFLEKYKNDKLLESIKPMEYTCMCWSLNQINEEDDYYLLLHSEVLIDDKNHIIVAKIPSTKKQKGLIVRTQKGFQEIVPGTPCILYVDDETKLSYIVERTKFGERKIYIPLIEEDSFIDILKIFGYEFSSYLRAVDRGDNSDIAMEASYIYL